VAGHLLLAGQLIDTEPELAHAHAEAARRRAARLPIVREAAAETAYAAGHFDTALSEFRALRRMTGTFDYLPVMADCERALGRPQAALKLAKESHSHSLDRAMQTEMTIVEAGARDDLGQHAESLRVLARAIERFPGVGEAARLPLVRLRYAYAEALLRAGREEAARAEFVAAAERDPDGETDAAQRVDALDGLVIELDESEDDEAEPNHPDVLEHAPSTRDNDRPGDTENRVGPEQFREAGPVDQFGP
jgi:tetratricopeptide (TPR) repeat protein